MVWPFILTVSAVSNVINVNFSHLRSLAPTNRPFNSLFRVLEDEMS